MKSLAVVPALLIVSAALAGLAVTLLRRAEKSGRSGLRWMLSFLGAWLGLLAAAACGIRWAYARHYHTNPDFLILYVPAAILAFTAALPFAWLLRSPRPRKETPPAPPKTPTSPTPSPAAAEIPPEPPSPASRVFKFPCPHCGQRLAVTTTDIGTTANCPNCATPLTVPSPASEG